jgi:hypothetical protein
MNIIQICKFYYYFLDKNQTLKTKKFNLIKIIHYHTQEKYI